jgi:hypothetical protein
VKFTDTVGGTELVIKMDPETSQVALTAVDGGAQTIHVAGSLRLDYADARSVADIDLNIYDGTGHLELWQ